MDENNMNNLNNGVDEEDEATTVLVAQIGRAHV